MDGNEEVRPLRAMNEASRIVAENQIRRLTRGRLKVSDLQPEASMTLTLFGIYGLNSFPYDEALNLSRSLQIRLESKPGGYRPEDRIIGINTEAGGRGRARGLDGYHAPLLRKGSKLRLALPEERNAKRIENPQTEWDILQGLILRYRSGDAPVARAYLEKHAAGRTRPILDTLHVWAEEVSKKELRDEARAMLFDLDKRVGS